MLRWASTWVWIVILAGPWLAAWGDGIHLDGITARTIGRGGTNLGFSDSAALIFDNPAAAVWLPRPSLLEISGGILFLDTHYSDPDNPRVTDLSLSPTGQFGFVQQTDDGLWAWGLGVFTPAGFSQQVDMRPPAVFGDTSLYKAFGSLTKVLPMLSAKLTDRLSLGGTLGVGIAHTELEGPYFIQSAFPFIGLPTQVDLQASGATLVYSLGLQYIVSERTTVGVTYQSESRFQLDGSAQVELISLLTARFDADVWMTYPRTVGIGLKHDWTDSLTVSADAVWYNWSSAFDSIGLRLTHPFMTLREELPMQWRDTVSFKFGMEKRLDSWQTVRGGYVYHRSPIPSETLTPYIPATMEHAFSLGYGTRYGHWEFDVAYMFLFGPKVQVTTGLPGGDFDNSRTNLYVHYVGVGAVRRF
ncbi:MAG: long-chain fatty acid outer membrane transporter [Planctomycetaceae bacterium]|nr:MAG: long-chain fatty acid outer membrane transporter [Planctomycetaceae bacterium]